METACSTLCHINCLAHQIETFKFVYYLSDSRIRISIYSSLLTSINEPNMSSHIKKMLQPGIWGSNVELLAAVTYFQIPIYILKENHCVWEVLKPLGSPQNFKYQLLPEIDIEAEDFRLPHHIELLHSNNCHYDSLISTAGCTSSSPPNIPEIHYDYTHIDLDT